MIRRPRPAPAAGPVPWPAMPTRVVYPIDARILFELASPAYRTPKRANGR
jgi:hypothetical protein